MKDDVHVCFHLLLCMIDIIFRESFLQLTHPKTHLTAIPCRFQKQIMLYHDQREKAVKLLLSSNFD